MPGKLNISIPTPCHENWQYMAVADKGRFCSSCQKNVVDFTTASDRQIAEAFKKESNVCGRFLQSQLERDLVIPKEKSSLWMAASAAVVAFFTLGNHKISAQTEKTEIVQIEKVAKDRNNLAGNKRIITGTVADENKIGIPGVTVKNKNSRNKIQTDLNGLFSIEAENGDIIEFSFIGMMPNEVLIENNDRYYIILQENYALLDQLFTVGGITVKRTFFGRIFYSVGNLFR